MQIIVYLFIYLSILVLFLHYNLPKENITINIINKEKTTNGEVKGKTNLFTPKSNLTKYFTIK